MKSTYAIPVKAVAHSYTTLTLMASLHHSVLSVLSKRNDRYFFQGKI